ncbi:MAG: hypothetical protein DI555_22915 [Novosphingobium pentaromativorans]|uniref:Uncharacterized protein n=1 Tax=Novosphingobium pentaromativorans TaxID=205844 RepID=A0A2W5PZY5_9SPHN|nr:MAG: hypothetical protein DI555_22915 [Novosphingobium pentaromativorans]
MNTIQQAARALAKKQSGHDDWSCLEEELRAELVSEAKAVIGALRALDENILSAGTAALRNRGFGLGHSDIAAAWSAMIEAALGDPPGSITLLPEKRH